MKRTEPEHDTELAAHRLAASFNADAVAIALAAIGAAIRVLAEIRRQLRRIR